MIIQTIFFCKNKDITLDMLISFQVLLSNHGYTKINQDMLSGCQEGKKMKAIILRFFPKMKNGLAVCNYNSYNYISNRHLIEGYEQEIKNIKNIESNKEFYLDNTKTDIWLKYQINNDLNNNDLIIKIDPKKSLFFGTFCISQNYNPNLNEDNYDSCFNINTQYLNYINLTLEKIPNENWMFFHIKGKIAGFIEILDLSLPKILDINSAYHFPMMPSIGSSKYIELSLPEIKEDIHANIILKNNNKTLEIFENEKKN